MPIDNKNRGPDRHSPIARPERRQQRQAMALRAVGIGLCATAISLLSIDALMALGGVDLP